MREAKTEAMRWWSQALSDFDFLPVARQAGKSDICCFLAQQTAEKALKAYLISKGEELVLTHSIFKLCAKASEFDESFRRLRERVKTLDFYYVEARYPNALEDVTPSEFYNDNDAADAIGMTKDVVDTVRSFLERGEEASV